MKSGVKALLLVLCAIVLVVATVFTTLAYLTSTTDEVKNTFTVGDVEIDLDEAKVTAYGEKDGDSRVKENQYKLIPGKTYVKDPTIHVDPDSEPAWIFAKIDNSYPDDISYNLDDSKWTLVEGTTNVYAYNTAIDPEEDELDVVVFNTMTVDGDAKVETMEDGHLNITGIAIQKQGFDTAKAAWDAAVANNDVAA